MRDIYKCKGHHSGGAFFDNLIWLTVKQTAFYLSRTENAIRILIHRGKLTKHRIDGKVYISKSEIDKRLTRSTLGGAYGN